MNVFIDFEASSLADKSYPVEVAWIFEDGRAESHLIVPAAGWDDWSDEAERIHGIPPSTLLRDGTAHDVVANRMVEQLSGHALFASAPSWDGKWLSVLLRAAGLPRHALRLRDTDEALREAVMPIVQPVVSPDQLDRTVAELIAWATDTTKAVPAHRALGDATEELVVWQKVQDRARDMVTRIGTRA